jgi:hypothetical protein
VARLETYILPCKPLAHPIRGKVGTVSRDAGRWDTGILGRWDAGTLGRWDAGRWPQNADADAGAGRLYCG